MSGLLVYVLGGDGRVRDPLSPGDLAEALGPFQALLPATRVVEVTVDLSSPQVEVSVDLHGLTVVQAVVVKTLTGAATLRFGGAGASPVTLRQGEVRDRLAVTGLVLNAPGGGALTLELHGR